MLRLAAANFHRPKGINFSSPDEVPSGALSRSLCRIASFLQDLHPYTKLQRYWDLWEEYGGHYYKEQIDFHGLFDIVESPRNLTYELTDGNVFVGIAPHDNSWYLRFQMDWDYDGFQLVGRFDVTLSTEIGDRFRHQVTHDLPVKLKEQDADAYYHSNSIGPAPG